MPEKIEFPNTHDRTTSSPAVLISRAEILAYWNQEHDSKGVGNEELRKWYVKQAELKGWNSADFFGDECLLSIVVKPKMKLTNDNLQALNQMKLSSKELRVNLESLIEKRDIALDSAKLSVAIQMLNYMDSIFETGIEASIQK